jgi:hypothetical protein
MGDHRRIYMSEMVERVAKALNEISLEFQEETAELYARAAIEAMREPTPAMMKFGAEDCGTTDLASTEDFEFHYGEVWRSMIDAALNEKSPTPPK